MRLDRRGRFSLSMGDRSPVIYVVEDDTFSAGLLESVLRRAGAVPRVFRDPHDFVHHIGTVERLPDILILDIILPGLNGIDLLRRIRRQKRFEMVPVMFLTALDDLDSKSAGFQAGADAYVSKPFNVFDLCLRLQALLRVKEYHERLEQVDNVLRTLVTIVESKDVYTKGHSVRVAELVATMGRVQRLSDQKVQDLYRAGLLHDIGKIAIDSTVLNKTGRLSADDWVQIRQHPVTGASILRGLESTHSIAQLISDHHERLDGSGYPQGKRGEEVSFYTRLLSLSDVFDALTSDRPYHTAISTGEALATIEREVERGWWDKEGYKILCRAIKHRAIPERSGPTDAAANPGD